MPRATTSFESKMKTLFVVYKTDNILFHRVSNNIVRNRVQIEIKPEKYECFRYEREVNVPKYSIAFKLRAGRARETQNHDDKNILQNEPHFVF